MVTGPYVASSASALQEERRGELGVALLVDHADERLSVLQFADEGDIVALASEPAACHRAEWPGNESWRFKNRA